LSFAGTFPGARAVLGAASVVQLGAGRVVVARWLGGALRLGCRPGWPPRSIWPWLVLAGAVVPLAFPLLLAVALMDITAAGAGVLAAILPLLTGLAALLIAREQPRRRFWWACSAGGLSVVIFSLQSGNWHWSAGNNWLAGGIVCAAIGYTAGARAVCRQSAWQVVCWMV